MTTLRMPSAFWNIILPAAYVRTRPALVDSPDDAGSVDALVVLEL